MANTIEELETQKAKVQEQIKQLVQQSATLDVEIQKAKRERELAFPVSQFVGKAFGIKSKEYKQAYALERFAKEHGYVGYKPLKETRVMAKDQTSINLECSIQQEEEAPVVITAEEAKED